MRQRTARVTRLAMSARVLAQRSTYVLLLSAAVALMVLDKTGNPFVHYLRVAIVDAAAPALVALSHPVAAAHRAVAEVEKLVYLHSENARLSADNVRLRRWEAVARQLEQDNLALRAMLKVGQEMGVRGVVTARVIGDSGGPFVRTMLLDSGTRKGVRKGQAALSGEGLVGRIVEAGERSARLLLLTDLNSRVPVVLEETRERGILAGNNSDRPRLDFVARMDRVRPGDRIVTSGHGGMFPSGLPIGVVASLSDGIPRVQPFVDWHRLEYVEILGLDRPGLEDRAAAGRPAGQP